MREAKNDLINNIQQALPKLSKSQKLIAKFVLEHYDKAAFMTAVKLSEAVGVSESTVIRFAFQIGFDGYTGLQEALQELIKAKLTSVQRIEVASNILAGEDILKFVLQSDIDKIKSTLLAINHKQFDDIVKRIVNARRIYIVGFRSAAPLAQFLGFYLNLTLENVRVAGLNSVSDIFEQIFKIGTEDVMIGISFPRYSKRSLKAVQYAHDKGASVIALTDSNGSPLVEFSDNVLFARSDMTSFVDSLVAPLSIINALIVAVGMSKKKEICETFESLERMWEEYDVYQK